MEYIKLDGHKIDPDMIDLFYDMRTGERVTDEEWDETMRRLREGEEKDARDA